MRPLLFLLCFLAAAMFAIASPAVAGCGPNGCTLEVPAIYEIQSASNPVVNVAACTARRSAACLGKVAIAPARLVASVVEKKPVRQALKAIASRKPVRRAAASGVRLLCFRRR